MRAHALRYCAAGLSVFPVCSPAMGQHTHHGDACESPGKVPLVAWARCQTEVTDLAQVDQWWNRWPDANIGFATGRASGVVVLDADGEDARKNVISRGGISNTPAIWTGRQGGVHFWFRCPDGADGIPLPRNFAGDRAGPGVDFRGEGGYALLPPSLHANGNRYRWADGTRDLEPIAMPRWLADVLRSPGAGKSPQGTLESAVSAWNPDSALDLEALARGIPEGQRNDQLWRYAGWLRAKDVPIDAARGLIVSAARACSPPFESDVALDMIRRAYQNYAPNKTLGSAGGAGGGGSDSGYEPDPVIITTAEPARMAPPPGVVLPFPLDVLADSIQHYITVQAEQLCAAPDGVALAIIVSAGNALGRNIRIKPSPGFVELGHLFAVLIGEPGQRKTGAINRGLDPYMQGIDEPIKKTNERKAKQRKEELAAWKKLPAKEKADREAPREPDPPTRVQCGDVTMEVLRVIIPSSTHTLLHRDELSGLLNGMNQYRPGGKGNDQAAMLEFWNTNLRGMTIDRVMSGSHYIPCPCLSIVGTIQPKVFARIHGFDQEDGAMERFLVVYPDPVHVEYRNGQDRQETGGLERMAEILANLHALEGATDMQGKTEPSYLELHPDAEPVFNAWLQSRSDALERGEFGPLSGRVAKDGTYLARLVLILHHLNACANDETVTNYASVDTVQRAIRLMEYFHSHYVRVATMMREEHVKDERTHQLDQARLEKILDALNGCELNTAEIFRLFNNHVAAKEIKAMLAHLEESEIITHRQVRAETGRPADLYRRLM